MSKVQKPVFGVGEWAAHSENVYCGCTNGCLYCYAHAEAVTRRKMPREGWAEPKILGRHSGGFKFRKYDGTVMFPTSHDITTENLDVCAMYLSGILAVGNRVLIVTKPRRQCVEALCKTLWWARNRVLFRFTIGSSSDGVLGFWEPRAPTFGERLRALECAEREGFKTSVSCEPMLDADIHSVISAVRPYVTDSIWLGRANYLLTRIAANGHADDQGVVDMARDLVSTWSDEAVMELYKRYASDPLIRWKESIKKVVGLKVATEKGLDK